MKAKNLLPKVLKSAPVVISGLFAALLFAMSAFSGLLDLNNEVFKIKDFKKIGIPVFIVVLAITFWDKIKKARREKPFYEASYVANDLNEKINAYLLDRLIDLMTSGAFRTIVKKHEEKLTVYFKLLIDDVVNKIDETITIDLLRQYDKAGNDPAKQRAFILSLFHKLSNIRDMEMVIRMIHKECIDELLLLFTDWIRTDPILKSYYLSFRPYGAGEMIDSDKFRINLDDISSDASTERNRIHDIGLQNLFLLEHNVADLKIASVFALLGLDTDDLMDIVDHIGNETGEQLLYEVIESIGIGLGVAAPVFFAIKIGRFLYRHRDRTEDLDSLRKDVEHTICNHLADIAARATDRVQQDADIFIKNLEKKFKDNIGKAGYYKAKAVSNL